jgi:hypothetical protein
MVSPIIQVGDDGFRFYLRDFDPPAIEQQSPLQRLPLSALIGEPAGSTTQ